MGPWKARRERAIKGRAGGRGKRKIVASVPGLGHG